MSKSALVRKRGTIKGRLTTYAKYVSDWSPSVGITALKLRIGKIEECWNEFNKIQDQILELEDDESQREESSQFENTYFEVLEKAYGLLDQNTSKPTINETGVTPTPTLPRLSLPRIELTTFSGDYKQWINFSEMFKSLVINDSTLSDVQRLYYLKSVVLNPAASLIRSLELTDANFQVAWNLLEERYYNKQVIINTLVRELFQLTKLEKESALGLRELLDTTQRNIQALAALKQPTQQWDTLLVHLITSKLDYTTKKLWEEEHSYEYLPNYLEIITFLDHRCRILENLALDKAISTKQSANSSKVESWQKAKPRENKTFLVQVPSCSLCKAKHLLFACDKFQNMTVEARFQHIKKIKHCINCLKGGHVASNCVSSNCKHCGKKHNSLLHRNITNSNNLKTSAQQSEQIEFPAVVNVSNIPVNTTRKNIQVLLSTAIVKVLDCNNKWNEARCLIDNGSQSNFISQELLNKLQLSKQSTTLPVLTINDTLTEVKSQVKLKIRSKNGRHYQKDLSALLIENISGSIPTTSLDITEFVPPSDIILADPEFHTPSPVHLLLGAEVFWDIMLAGSISLGHNNPTLKETKLGWICTGSMLVEKSYENHVKCNLNIEKTLDEQLHKFFNVEEIVENSVTDLGYSEKCEVEFLTNVTRDSRGRYKVKLPTTDSLTKLGDSKALAYKRLYSLETNLEKSPHKKVQYIKFMREYEKLGHMSLIDHKQDAEATYSYYIPHFAVLRDCSTSTPLRVVFDASQKTSTGVSLNDVLEVGSQVQDSLFSIILRFRTYRYVISGDIEKFFRQIQIDDKQRSLQKILWRENRNEPVKIFQLNTVTYGMVSSPYLASRTLKQLIQDEGSNYPLAVENQYNWMVDDFLGGTDYLEETIKLRKEISELLSLGGFRVYKWNSNDLHILHSIPEQDRNKNADLQFESDTVTKILGLTWQTAKDELSYQVFEGTSLNTKRAILSDIAKIFDPLGLVGPILTQAKLIMQELWKNKIGWDEPVPHSILDKWLKFKNELRNLLEIKIPRCVKLNYPLKDIQLHVFADASTVAYGCSAYMRCSYETGEISSRLIMSKSRIAPIKSLTMPKLELSAAALAVQLTKIICSSLKLSIEIFYWTDSSIVISWLKKDINKLDIFVRNRISKILNNSSVSQWNHVPSRENPADLISRGATPKILLVSSLWFEGPDWLKYSIPEFQDKDVSVSAESEEEIQPVMCNKVNITTAAENISSMTKLIRVTAYCKRFVSNCRKEKKNRSFGPLSVEELDIAWHLIIHQTQKEVFDKEIRALEKQKDLPKDSNLQRLSPYLDENGMLRVGGRLQYANLDENQKHPLILPSNHRVTNLIIMQQHLKLLHAGIQLLLATLRQKVWILKARKTISSVLRKCITCFKVKPQLAKQLMGQIPKDRVTPNRPFEITGVDLCGPVFIKENTARKARQVKTYIVVFVCFSTKAVHLELVENLTTEAFINALKRFISRRGICKKIYSDNATNFVGSNRKLKELKEIFHAEANKNKLVDFAANEGIEWRFIPPLSPHHGGIWEAAVKQFKYHLKRVLGTNVYTYEGLNTLTIQIEGCLNSRPLTPLSNDPTDLEVLTPAHFIIGTSLKTLPDINYVQTKDNRLKMWEQIQKKFQNFWKGWSKNYLTNLQVKHKWFSPKADINVGTLVLIEDRNLPPLMWKRGRISKLFPGQDGKVRVVSVITNSGKIIRSIQHLAPLPLESC